MRLLWLALLALLASPLSAAGVPDTTLEHATLIQDPARVDLRSGRMVALSGDRLLVLAAGNPFGLPGAVSLYRRTPTGWIEDAHLDGIPLGSWTNAAIDGRLAAFSTPDRVRVFRIQRRGWTELDAPVLPTHAAGRPIGQVALAGRRLAVGTFAGPVVFRREKGRWIEEASFDVPGGEGRKVALSDRRLLTGSGAFERVHVFARRKGEWRAETTLQPWADRDLDQDFGFSFAVSGNRIVVGAPFRFASAYVFRRAQGVWIPEERLQPADAPYQFGQSVAIERNKLVATGEYRGLEYRRRPTRGWKHHRTLRPRYGSLVQGSAISRDLIALANPCGGPFEGSVVTFESGPTAAIEITPDDYGNDIFLDGSRPLELAVLGSESFDIAELDLASLRFGPARAERLAAFGARIEFVDRGPEPDLVMRFAVSESGLTASDFHGCLTGRLRSGEKLLACDWLVPIEAGTPSP